MGFFNKAQLCDILIIGDHVQYRRYGFQNRVKIKTPNEAQWLTVPIIHEGDQPINTVKIFQEKQSELNWYERHLKTLQVNYAKAKYYDEYIGKFEKTYKKGYELLADLNLEFIKTVLEILELNIPIKKTSEMNLTKSKTELIIEIANKVGADTYLSGIRGVRYLDESAFQKNNIVLRYNKYEHPRYNQQFMDLGFIEGLSILDLIFNEGPQSLEIIKSGFPGF
jgi:hypothetical protein